ncbi:MAG TPA: hypothetical protein VGO89_03100 [Streptomyces sp.]|nr:hypothetical protein [Streptomyces sp.]
MSSSAAAPDNVVRAGVEGRRAAFRDGKPAPGTPAALSQEE